MRETFFSFLLRQLKKALIIIFLSVKSFYTEKRFLWAISLTYTSIFSLIPLLSVVFILFNIFGDLSKLKHLVQPIVYKVLAPGSQAVVLNTLDEIVNSIHFGSIGIYSALFLVVSFFLLIFEMEYVIRDIWKTKNKLSIVLRATIYWTVITVFPLLLSVLIFIAAKLHKYKAIQIIETYIDPHIIPTLTYGIVWISFIFVYFFMAGTKVKLRSAVFGGIIAGISWQTAGWLFTIYTSKFFYYYPKVYGPLAAIPLFLLWLFLCWIIFVIGAEISYFHQNYETETKKDKDLQLLKKYASELDLK